MRILIFSCITIALWTINYYSYNQAVIKKQATPTLGFWFTIAVLDWITLISLLLAGVYNLGLTQVVVWTIGATVTCELVRRQYGYFKLDRVEIYCLILSLSGLILGKVIGNPKLSILLQIVAYIAASVPFWRNALKGKEKWQTLLPAIGGSVASLGTLVGWSLERWVSLIIPIMGLVLNLLSLICSYIGRQRFGYTNEKTF